MSRLTGNDAMGLMEAYASVYDENLRDEFFYVHEDLSFIDELTDNELCLVMENLIVTEEVDINECFDSLDYFLSEATVTYGHQDRRIMAKTAERQKKVRVGRMKQAIGKAAKNIASNVSGGAKFLYGKLSSAAKRIGKFLGRVRDSAKSGYTATKKEFSGQAAREARARSIGREMRRAARKQASEKKSKDTSEFETPARLPQGPYRGQGSGRKEKVGGEIKPESPITYDLSSDRRKNAIQKLNRQQSGRRGGTRFAGPGGEISGTAMHSGQGSPEERAKKAKTFAKKIGLGEEFVYILEEIMIDMIFEDCASNLNEAVEILESLSYNNFSELINEYLSEDVDIYDIILSYLLDEGYADSEEAANVIMVNMSEDWKNDIVEYMLNEGPSQGPKIPYGPKGEGITTTEVKPKQNPSSNRTLPGTGNRGPKGTPLGLNTGG